MEGYQTTPQPLKIFVVLHVFLVPIISSHDKLWGLARRVFTLFTFGRALSSQPTPYQVLKLKLQKLQKLQKDNDDDSTQDCRFLRFTFTFLHDVQNIAPGHK